MTNKYTDIYAPMKMGLVSGKTFLAMIEEQTISILLHNMCYNKSRVAQDMGISRPKLNKLIKKYKLQ